MGKLAEEIETLRRIKQTYGNQVNIDETISSLLGNKTECPACHGSGKHTFRVWVKDLMWGHWEYQTTDCSTCKGEGYV